MEFTIFVRLYLYEYLDGYFSVKSQVDVEYETPQSRRQSEVCKTASGFAFQRAWCVRN